MILITKEIEGLIKALHDNKKLDWKRTSSGCEVLVNHYYVELMINYEEQLFKLFIDGDEIARIEYYGENYRAELVILLYNIYYSAKDNSVQQVLESLENNEIN